jgi:hypothetical protein
VSRTDSIRSVVGALSVALVMTACGPGGTLAPTGTAPTGTAPQTARPTLQSSPTPAMAGLTGRIVFTRAGGPYGDETTFVANIDASDVATGRRA